MTIADQIHQIRQIIQLNAQKSGRNPDHIRLMAVSKTHPVSAIQAAYESGITDFGESYVSEAVEKVKSIQNQAITWHFIGPIQSNKTRSIAENFRWVHSVDRPKIAQRLSAQRPSHLPALQICVQVNFFDEAQKKGVSKDALLDLLGFVDQQPNTVLRGLMVIPPPQSEYSKQLEQFVQVAETYHKLQNQFPSMDTLSMGMSNDIEAAIAAGSNMIRIGTAIFGPRGNNHL
ncbi:YggS family pyridoxal phosphate-dependent enzyme [Aliikangiella marina]|uniref:Pyridoxal phosphate homeostasis protein n=1 Tax=Aliikangiella marina TaxID=1712262 RepID=A0A545TA18_9GAMM|nr:YggS family pyridoxal phosphate-dependent enzyme [Aliikangiella marina]TQV74062.1 YggS family pyridoxal phosphate-dependent enzyme [Aliikangiella marina]